MSDIPDDAAAPPPGGPIRLNGWKDIAAHLDRGVRTVQRWEKEFGLPVRRLGPGRGEGVFAFAHEIDQWQATAQAARARFETQAPSTDSAGDSAADGQPEVPSVSSARSPSGFSTSPRGDDESGSAAGDRRLKIAVGVLAVVMVLTVAWAGWSSWRAADVQRGADSAATGEPAAWRVDGDSLVVLDASGRTCWTRRLPTEVDAGFYARHATVPGAIGGVGDIDHDGRREVWIIVAPASADAAYVKLLLFNEDGASRWEYQHAGTATFGSTIYGGPWVVYRAFITEAPEDPRRHALWVSSHDVSEYPTVLVRLDIASGKPLGGPYWSNGWVNSALLMRTPDRVRLAVGGTNNDQRAPGIALLDATDIAGTAPAERDKYRCTTCPPGGPLAVAVFPKPRRFASSPGGGGVEAISGGGPVSSLLVMVTYAVTSAGIPAAALFRLDTDLRPLQADTADGYLPAYEQLVRAGEISAFGPLAKDPASELLPILRWDSSARRYVPTPIAPRAK